MKIYDIMIDNRGRLLLPKQIRALFASGARITQRDHTDKFDLEPLLRDVIDAEVDVICDPASLVNQAWTFNVSIIPVGEENGNAVIRCHGKYNDVRSFCSSLGYPEEDFDILIIGE